MREYRIEMVGSVDILPFETVLFDEVVMSVVFFGLRRRKSVSDCSHVPVVSSPSYVMPKLGVEYDGKNDAELQSRVKDMLFLHKQLHKLDEDKQGIYELQLAVAVTEAKLKYYQCNDMTGEDFDNLYSELSDRYFKLSRSYNNDSLTASAFRFCDDADIERVRYSTHYYQLALECQKKKLNVEIKSGDLSHVADSFKEMAERYAPENLADNDRAIAHLLSYIACLNAAATSAINMTSRKERYAEISRAFLDLARRYQQSPDHGEQYYADALKAARFYAGKAEEESANKLFCRVNFMSGASKLRRFAPEQKLFRSLRMHFNLRRYLESLIALSNEANRMAANDNWERALDYYQSHLCAILDQYDTNYLCKLYLRVKRVYGATNEVLQMLVNSAADCDDVDRVRKVSSLQRLSDCFVGSLEKVLMMRSINVAQLEKSSHLHRLTRLREYRYNRIIEHIIRRLLSGALVLYSKMPKVQDPEQPVDSCVPG